MYEAVGRRLSQLQEAGVLSAKRPESQGAGPANWYPCYAGFSEAFVTKVLSARTDPVCVVVDPWNGAGTTTTISDQLGYDVHGFDLNPVAVLVASAKLVDTEEANHVGGLVDQVVHRADETWRSKPARSWTI